MMPRSGLIAALLAVSSTFVWTQSDPASGGATAGRATGSVQSTSSQSSSTPGKPGSETSGYVGNEACAGCHSAIYQSYSRTPMARASGPAIENVIPCRFFPLQIRCSLSHLFRRQPRLA